MKQEITKWLKDPNINRKIASKLMDILALIQQEEEIKSNNFSKFTDEELKEIGMRLHKKFQSSLETKI